MSDQFESAARDPVRTALYVWDRGSDAVNWTSVGEDWRGFLSESRPAAASDLAELPEFDDRTRRARAVASLQSNGAPAFVRYRLSGAGGTVWVRERLTLLGRDQVEGELTLLSASETRAPGLEGAETYDVLTGVFGRARLLQGLRLAVAKALKGGGCGCYMTADLDHFSTLNHALGCDVGDRVLTLFAERLRQVAGSGCLLGRVGDDSFGIILEGTSEEGALAVAERIVRSLAENPIRVDDDIAVTASVGAVVFPALACSAEEAIARADLAVASAKAGGRNHYELYALSEDQRAVQRRDLAIARQVQEAVLDGRLVFVYQPVVDAHSHRPVFYECLLRIRSPNDTLVPAGQFVPVVEGMGLMRQIDFVVLDMAMKELARAPDVVLAINVSATTTAGAAWGQRLEKLNQRLGGVASRLIVEITETAAIRNVEAAQSFADAVHACGAKVALDDFGAGYSSFRHLRGLSIDLVKIDGLFTGRLLEDPDNMLFLRALQELAGGSGVQTVAECAETAQDAVLLTAAGIDYLQGYHFAKPELTRLQGAPVLPISETSRAFDAADALDPGDTGGLRYVS